MAVSVLGPQFRTFGASLAACRMNRAFTQQKLADEVGVARDTVRNWENGYRLPGAHHLRALVAILGLRWDTEDTVTNDPIGPKAMLFRVVVGKREYERRLCAFDPRHAYTTAEAPPSLYCGPACMSAAQHQAHRRQLGANGSGR